MLPDSLPETFTVAELAKAGGFSQRLAQKMAYTLRHMGALEVVRKRGRAFVYRKTETDRFLAYPHAQDIDLWGEQDDNLRRRLMVRTAIMSVGGVSFSGNFSNEMFQEMSFSTAMDNAEIGQPGMMMNLVPKEGGNAFHGSVFYNFTTESFNDDNAWGINKEKTPNTSFTIGIDTPNIVRQKTREAEGYRILKVKLGGSDDRAMVEAIRSVTDKPLCVDVNQGWQDRHYALEMIHWLKDKGVLLVEQPLALLVGLEA
jgi:hypothetical protein